MAVVSHSRRYRRHAVNYRSQFSRTRPYKKGAATAKNNRSRPPLDNKRDSVPVLVVDSKSILELELA